MPDKVEGPGQGSTDRPKLSLGNKEKFDEALSEAGVELTKPTKPKPNESPGPPPGPPPPPPR